MNGEEREDATAGAVTVLRGNARAPHGPGRLRRADRSDRPDGARRSAPSRGPVRARLRGPGILALFLVDVAATTWVFLLCGLLWWANVPMVAGWHPRVVLTGSMSPTIMPGDVVVTAPVGAPEHLPLGRVVVVRDPTKPGGSYTHRLVGRDTAGNLLTRGDANPSTDFPAIPPRQVLGQVRLVIPGIGLPVVWLRQHRYLQVVSALLVTWAALLVMFRGFRRHSRERTGAEPIE